MRDITDNWLKENDPLYKKRNKLKHPYYSERQMDEISKREIPVSSLGTNYIKARFEYSEEEVMDIKDFMD